MHPWRWSVDAASGNLVLLVGGAERGCIPHPEGLPAERLVSLMAELEERAGSGVSGFPPDVRARAARLQGTIDDCRAEWTRLDAPDREGGQRHTVPANSGRFRVDHPSPATYA